MKTMSATQFSTVATDLIESYGNTVQHVIDAYRAGAQRVASVLDQRWSRAFDESRSQLSDETADNASAAKDLVSGYYSKGLAVTSRTAQDVVAQVVKLAGTGVQRAASNAQAIEVRTGFNGLSKLAEVSLPSVVALNTLASQLEQRSAVLARKVAGDDVLAVAKRASARKVRKAKAAK
jgi:hypothetical protein